MPNPTRDKAVISFDSSLKGDAEVNITDIFENQVFRTSSMVYEGANEINIASEELSSGVYVITMYIQDEIQTVRFIKE